MKYILSIIFWSIAILSEIYLISIIETKYIIIYVISILVNMRIIYLNFCEYMLQKEKQELIKEIDNIGNNSNL